MLRILMVVYSVLLRHRVLFPKRDERYDRLREKLKWITYHETSGRLGLILYLAEELEVWLINIIIA